MKIEQLALMLTDVARAAAQSMIGNMAERLAAMETKLAGLPAPEKGDRGEPGAPGKDADIESLRQLIQTEVKAAALLIPPGKDGRDGRDGLNAGPGKDGEPGKDGRDGFSLEDFTASMGDDGRTITLAFKRGDLNIEHKLRVPAMIYRGIWREAEYERGDVVTLSGSAWHCQEDKTADKPGLGGSGWKLMVKEGRPGKDGGAPAAAVKKPVSLG